MITPVDIYATDYGHIRADRIPEPLRTTLRNGKWAKGGAPKRSSPRTMVAWAELTELVRLDWAKRWEARKDAGVV